MLGTLVPAVAVFVGKLDSSYQRGVRVPRVGEIPSGCGIRARVSPAGVGGTNKEINAAKL